MQQYQKFFEGRDDDLLGTQQQIQQSIEEIKQNEIGRKLKNCYVCKNQKVNHLVREMPNQEALAHDDIRQSVMALTPRDTIEQVVFDPNLGIVKREIHFGIIDYLTVREYKFINVDVSNEEETRRVDICLEQ